MSSNRSASEAYSNATDSDPYERLQIVPNADGTIIRLFNLPTTPPSPHPTLPIPVLSKDLTINQSNNTWARVFLPRQPLDSSSSSPVTPKLPLIVAFHGGGFILFSAASTVFHDFCANIAAEASAVIVSVEYRLAPEHRLPAAYDDAVEALRWIRTSPDDWLREFADFGRCFLMGGSAGGNIAYHAGLRVAENVDDIEPLKIQGMILHQPFFGGTKRTESEVRMVNDRVLPPVVTDMMWELALPVGADRDHEYCNQTVGSGPKVLEKIRSLGWRILVVGCQGDPLIDRQVEMVKMMEEKGIKVESHFSEGGYHGQEVAEPSTAKAHHVVYRNFIWS